MIDSIKGRIREISDNALILDVGILSLIIEVDLETSSNLNVGDEVELKVHLTLGDEIRIYGFLNDENRELFRKLMKVSKVGPKKALRILSSTGASTLVEMINNEDVESLARLPGVGRKTAERIITELKGELIGASAENPKILEEAIQALEALGYTRFEAGKAVRTVFKNGMDTPEVIKEALKVISRL